MPSCKRSTGNSAAKIRPPTSFPLRNAGGAPGGEIAISLERAAAQAIGFGHLGR